MRMAVGPAEVRHRKKSPIGANISGGSRVCRSMQDETPALLTGHAGAERGTETNEVTMFAGWTIHVSTRFEAGCLAGQPANTLSVYLIRL